MKIQALSLKKKNILFYDYHNFMHKLTFANFKNVQTHFQMNKLRKITGLKEVS